jgi:hypothetical protein
MGVKTLSSFKILPEMAALSSSTYNKHLYKLGRKEWSKLVCFIFYLSHSVTNHVTQMKVNLNSNNLSYERSINSSKESFQTVKSIVTFCNFPYPLFSITPLVIFFTSLLSLRLSLTRELFRRQFLHKI